MADNGIIYQVLVAPEGYPELSGWFETKKEAETHKAEQEELFDAVYWIEEGTEYITRKCRGCGSVHASERCDAYDIFTGDYCDECYNDSSKYPYKKHRYDYESYGERLEDDY